jgi:pectate lyase
MATFNVSNQTQLDSAIRAARSGDTILLQPGTYSSLTLDAQRSATSHVDFDREVVIASANASRPAVINNLLLRGAENVELRGLEFDGTARSGHNFQIQRSANIEVTNSDFEGRVGGSQTSGTGIRINDSRNVDVLNSDFTGFYNAIFGWNNRDLTISGNSIAQQSNDAMQFGFHSGIVISNNDFGQTRISSGGHKDLIQFYTSSSQAPSEDIRIVGNRMSTSESVQGIFMGNELARNGNRNAFYENVVIEDNVMRTSHPHGITVEHGNRVSILDNEVLRHPNGARDPMINVSNSSVYVTIRGNEVVSVPDPAGPTWNVGGNDLTSSRNFTHWEGSGATLTATRSFVASTASTLASADPATTGASAREVEPSGEQVRVDGRSVDGTTTIGISGLDLDAGDELVFINFDRGTFRDQAGGNVVHNSADGSYVRIDDILDLRELFVSSPAIDVATTAQNDALILRIAQDDGDVARIVLNGLGAEFRGADQPDLF